MTYPGLTSQRTRARIADAIRLERKTLTYCRAREDEAAGTDLARTKQRVYASMRADMRERIHGMQTILTLLYA